MKKFLLFFGIILFFSCKDATEKRSKNTLKDTTSTKDFREFKVLDSKYIDVSEVWKPFNEALKNFTESTYEHLKPLILEQDIPTLQKHIQQGDFTYETLVKFYLYRIRKFDRNNKLSLNSVIALNPNIISEAKQKYR